MKQKKILVQFNRPLSIISRDSTETDLGFQTFYGFLTDYDEDEEMMEKDIRSYVGYLSALHEWSNDSPQKFSIYYSRLGLPEWMDENGVVHYQSMRNQDEWSYNLGTQASSKLGLKYSQHLIDIDIDEFPCGIVDKFITCWELMDKLVKIAQEQEETRITVFLFNRPIWLPKSSIWLDDEKGYVNLYGLVWPDGVDRKLFRDCEDYLGHLALNEYYYLNGETPSGFRLVDNKTHFWTKDGKKFYCMTDEIIEESQICKEMLNLEIKRAVVRLPKEEIAEGVRQDFIISQELYEYLLDVVKDDAE